MDFELFRHRSWSRALAGRAVACSALLYATMHLLISTQLYATAVVAFGLSLLMAYDMRRVIERARRSMIAIPSRPSEQSERQLQFLEALLDTVTAALLIVEADGSLKLANRAARRLAGQPASRLEHITTLGDRTAATIQGMKPGERKVLHLADGQPVHVAAVGFMPGEGKQQRLISLQRVTGELDAVEVKAWQDVVGTLTHEMMNSLTPIASLAESLEHLLGEARGDEAASRELFDALEAIKRRSQGLMNFVARYRAVAEMPRPQLRTIHLDSFFFAIDRLMSAKLRQAGVAYERRSVEPGLAVVADAELLEQAVINLIGNASDAAVAAAGPRVIVSCELQDGELSIAVSDNGIGLVEGQRDLIFLPFYTTKPHGSGIGLSLARQVALAHGGRIDVQPNPPAGSVFRLVVPHRC